MNERLTHVVQDHPEVTSTVHVEQLRAACAAYARWPSLGNVERVEAALATFRETVRRQARALCVGLDCGTERDRSAVLVVHARGLPRPQDEP